MVKPLGEAEGVLILRAWVTSGPETVLRVGITQAIGRNESPRLTVTDTDAACGAVRLWLDDLISRAHGTTPL